VVPTFLKFALNQSFRRIPAEGGRASQPEQVTAPPGVVRFEEKEGHVAVDVISQTTGEKYNTWPIMLLLQTGAMLLDPCWVSNSQGRETWPMLLLYTSRPISQSIGRRIRWCIGWLM
jgi:hypothetical protein